MRVRGGFVLVALLWSCGGGQSASPAGAAGSGAGTSGGAGTGAAGTGAAGTGAAGTGGSGTAGAGAAGAGAPPCLGLRDGPDAKVLFTPDSAWQLAGVDDLGMLVSVDVNRSVRIVALENDGSMKTLLSETEYARGWSFDPEVLALRQPDGIDLLVGDGSEISLVRKRGSQVRVIELATTSSRDLFVRALAPGASGPQAVFVKGDIALNAQRPMKVTVVDVDALLAAHPGTGAASLQTALAAMTAWSRTFTAPTSIGAATSRTGFWLTSERLDPATDCKPTGETEACPPGAALPRLDCAWHLDTWHITKVDGLQGAPVRTIDGRLRTVARCDDTTPAGLATVTSTYSSGPGTYRHHIVGVDAATSRLGLALFHQTTAVEEVQLALVEPSGAVVFDGATAQAPNGSSWWLATRDGHVFVGASISEGTDVVAADASKVAMIHLMTDLSATGVVPRADGFDLVGGRPNDLTFAMWSQALPCVH